jgi:hypothetical protein
MVRKMIAATGLGLLALWLLAMPAFAGKIWCYRDPIVLLNGSEVQILVAVPEEDQWRVEDAVEVKIKTPKGVMRETIFTDAGFNGHGEEVSYGNLSSSVKADGSFKVEVYVEMDTDSSGSGSGEIPVLVTVITADGSTFVAEGTSDGTKIAFTTYGS